MPPRAFSAFAFLLIVLAPFLTGAKAHAADDAPSTLAPLIERIKNLESNRDPKCVATATRLENFMYGTPLNAEARYEKVAMQKQLIRRIWADAAARAARTGLTTVISQVMTSTLSGITGIQSGANGDIVVTDNQGEAIEITTRDFEHYSSIAFAMRAILAVEQEQLLLPGHRLLPLDEDAIADMERFLNIYTLAALQLADRAARASDERELTADRLRAAWTQIGKPPAVPETANAVLAAIPTTGETGENFKVIRSIIAQKLASYEAYNKISMAVFLRNLQVYFARYRWPSDAARGEDFRDTFNTSMIAYVEDALRVAQRNALAAQHPLIRAEDIEPVIENFVPFRVNEYEDVIFFPRLGSRQVVLEAYDIDSFRDSGIHWRYLKFALDNPKLDVTLEPDPFAAELIVEGVAQFGVLALRLAGVYAKQSQADSLDVSHLVEGLKEIQRRIDDHAAAPPLPEHPRRIHSAAVSTDTPDGKRLFSDITVQAGIAFEHRTADWLSRMLRSYLRTGTETATLSIPPAFGGGGVAAEDIDGDGDGDILLVGGLRNALYLNNGDGTFQDVTELAGIDVFRADGSHGEPRQPVIADFDNDGVQDILITYANDDHRLYRGLGKSRFEDVAATAGLGGAGLVGGPAVVFDYDRDGLLDIYIGYFGNYLQGILPTLSRRNENGLPNKLFRNLGKMRFGDVTEGSGVDNTGWTQAASHTDLDGDGWQDLIVGNDFGVNSYYRNLGNGRFEDIAPTLGTDKPSFTMNVGIADLNRDQFPDIYISNIVTMVKDDKYTLPDKSTPMHFSLRSMARMRVVEANDLFTSVSEGGQLKGYQLSEAVARGYNSTGWAWDADFFDFDLDGDDDLYVLNGMNEYSVYSDTPYYTAVHDKQMEITLPVAERESNVFFVNEDGKLQNRSDVSGIDYLGNSRSAAYLDIDGDGDLDIVVNNYQGPGLLYRNDLAEPDRHWLKVKLVGDPAKGSNRDAIGARLVFDAEDGLRVWREVHGTIGYLSVHPREQHFGLGKTAEGMLSITWPNGEKEVVGPLSANNRYIVVQGLGVVAR